VHIAGAGPDDVDFLADVVLAAEERHVGQAEHRALAELEHEVARLEAGGDGFYNDDGTSQTVTQMKGKKKVAEYDLAIESDAQLSPDGVRVTGLGGNRKFKVNYFDESTKITDAVTGAGYVIDGLDPGEKDSLTLKVKVRPKAKSGNQRSTLVTWTSENDDKKVDAVLAITQRK
jgi:hypothetical protein